MVPPVVVYQSALRDGDRVFTSGQLPMKDGQLMTPGKLGGAVSHAGRAERDQTCALGLECGQALLPYESGADSHVQM